MYVGKVKQNESLSILNIFVFLNLSVLSGVAFAKGFIKGKLIWKRIRKDYRK